MRLKTLGGKPADFPLAITVQELDGSDVQVPFIAIGRTTLDWQPVSLARLEKDTNALIEQEEKLEAEKAKAAQVEEGKKRKRIKFPHAEIAETTAKNLEASVGMVREVASGWELDDEFSDDNIKALIVRFPGIQTKLWSEYDARVKGNRLGNSKAQ